MIFFLSSSEFWVFLYLIGCCISILKTLSSFLSKKIGTTNGLPSTVVHCFVEANEGSVWIGTSQGLSIFYFPNEIFNNPTYSAEYILIEGNEKVILCERGVSVPHTHRSTSRFLLDLQVVPAAKEVTHLPIVVDPSHATFWRPWVKPMALASVASGADGIMLEVHPDPSNAAVDPLQPIDFDEFESLCVSMNNVAKAIGRKIS